MEWQQIETAPKDGTEILLALAPNSNAQDGQVVIGAFYYSVLWGDCWMFNGDYTITADGGATHWMPLPKLPEAE